MLVFPFARRVVLQQRSRPLTLFASRASFVALRSSVHGQLRRPAFCQLSTLPSQAPPSTWVERLPPKVRPYLYLMRVDKPIGTILLFYPAAWSIMMASYSVQAPFTTCLTYFSLCGLGAFILRSAGCTMNDMWDRDFDKVVERTKRRPIAHGDITVPRAFVFLGAQLSVGLGLLLQFDWNNIILGASSMILVVLYPFTKRITYWPQAVLGLALNWGSLFGWAAVTGSTDLSVCLPLYVGGICWTIVYDTIYAHQDKLEDAKAGIRSTALLFGPRTVPILSAFSASSLSLIALSGYMNGGGVPFYAGVGIAAMQLARVLKNTDFESRESCWKGFVACGWSGFWIWTGMLCDYLTVFVPNSI